MNSTRWSAPKWSVVAIAIALTTLLLVCPSTSSRSLSWEDFGRALSEGLDGEHSTGLRAELKPLVPEGLSRQERIDFSRSRSIAAAVGSEVSEIGTRLFVVPYDYVLTFQMGTPPQNFTAIPSTGADLIWVQCTSCDNCSIPQSALFNPDSSSSYTAVPCSSQLCSLDKQQSCNASDSICSYEYPYADGTSSSGTIATETIIMGDVPIPSVVIGCADAETGAFANADGVVGLGRGNLSLPSQLSTTVGRVFAYCLLDYFDLPTASSPIVFGNSPLSSDPMLTFTPLISNPVFPSFYYVNLTGMSVAGQLLQISNSSAGNVSNADVFAIDPATGSGGTVFGSGTSFSHLPQLAYDALKQAVEAALPFPVLSTSNFDCCFNVSGVVNGSVPEIVFHFEGADLFLANNSSFIFDGPGEDILCLATLTESLGPSVIIGNHQQQDLVVVYDVDNSRLGWKYQKCDTL